MILLISEEFKEKILQKILEQNPISFSELYRKIGGNRNKLSKAITILISDGMIQKKKTGHRNEVELSLIRSDLARHLEAIKRELPVIQSLLKKQMKVLKKRKYLFKFPVKVREDKVISKKPKVVEVSPVTWKINPKAKRDIQFFTQCINWLFQNAGSLTYAEVIGDLPRTYGKIIREYHKECLELIKNSISDLFETHPEERGVIRMYLDFNIRGLIIMAGLGQLSKRKI